MYGGGGGARWDVVVLSMRVKVEFPSFGVRVVMGAGGGRVCLAVEINV